ncbi:MAG: hypothetical protein ACXU82_16290 [Caulobacteraceae bacterium]
MAWDVKIRTNAHKFNILDFLGGSMGHRRSSDSLQIPMAAIGMKTPRKRAAITSARLWSAPRTRNLFETPPDDAERPQSTQTTHALATSLASRDGRETISIAINSG